MNFYKEIKNELIKNESYKKVKDYSKNRNDLITYYNVGKLLADAGKHYGEGIIKKYSEKLVNELNKKYNYRNLMHYRKFYIMFKNEKVNALRTVLSWTHYRVLLKLNDYEEVKYYIDVAENENLSYRELEERIKLDEYGRLSSDAKNKLINKEKLEIGDRVKNPIIIKTNGKEVTNEYILKELIFENIGSFLKQLGSSYSYIDKEYKIKVGNTYNYLDFLLYNIKEKCYVVLEVKLGKLKKEHYGQITLYMNAIDKTLKDITDTDTIGILLTKENNKFVIEYLSKDNIIPREYKLLNI